MDAPSTVVAAPTGAAPLGTGASSGDVVPPKSAEGTAVAGVLTPMSLCGHVCLDELPKGCVATNLLAREKIMLGPGTWELLESAEEASSRVA